MPHELHVAHWMKCSQQNHVERIRSAVAASGWTMHMQACYWGHNALVFPLKLLAKSLALRRGVRRWWWDGLGAGLAASGGNIAGASGLPPAQSMS
jgi:hypothetical protein